MIINEESAIARLNSPHNLMNKLKSLGDKKNSAMSLFGIGRKDNKIESPKLPEPVRQESFNPFPLIPSTTAIIDNISEPSPTLDNILENHEAQVKLGLAHDNALALLNASVAMLSTKLDNVKAEKLPAVISAASKTVESIRRERAEASKNGKDKEVHYHFYTPTQKTVADFNIIDVA